MFLLQWYPLLLYTLMLTYPVKQKAYSSVFTEELQGENVEFCLPDETIVDAGLEDFTWCT
jgi:hypothetical protein